MSVEALRVESTLPVAPFPAAPVEGPGRPLEGAGRAGLEDDPT
jgi:hypothetical protein